MKLIACKLAGNILRDETVDGRRHIVVPVIAMVEGVHQGISGPNQPGPRTFYQFSELSAAAGTLEGAPVTINHPMTATELVSARSPEGRPFVCGMIHNVRAEDNKLKAEAWIDVEKLQSLSLPTYENLTAGVPVEVSLGIYGSATSTQGMWNNEQYDEVLTGLSFDHLALLPGAKGACSFDDGCGVRANKSQSDKPKEINVKETFAALFAFFVPKKKITPTEARVTAMISANASPFAEEHREFLMGLDEKVLRMLEVSFDEIRVQLWAFINGLDSPEYINFLEDAYDGYFVYRAERRNQMGGAASMTLYKRSYSVDSGNNKVSIGDDAAEVTKKIEYVPVGNSTANVTSTQESAVKEQLIKGLIESDRTPFKEEHRPMLIAMTECQLQLLSPDNFKPVPAPTGANAAGDPPKPDAPANQPPKEAATVAEYLSQAPAEIATTIKSAMARDAANKTALIAKITANTACPWTKEELELKDFGELQKVAAAAKIDFDPTVDYSGQAGSTLANQGSKVPPMPSTAPEMSTK